MNLSVKILTFRKKLGLSQEELAEKLNVSRQAISRWETGSALPDAYNVLQLSRFFNVSADFLLNDDCDTPTPKGSETSLKKNTERIAGICIVALGAAGNIIIYILSRFIRVMVPYITYKNGEKWYNWSSEFTGYSYKYFIQSYNLEILTFLFGVLIVLGLFFIFVGRSKFAAAMGLIKGKICKKSNVSRKIFR